MQERPSLADLFGQRRELSRTEKVKMKHSVTFTRADGSVKDLGIVSPAESTYAQAYACLDEDIVSMTIVTVFDRTEGQPVRQPAIPNADEIVAAEMAGADPE